MPINAFSPLLDQLIDIALIEDLHGGDASTDPLFDPDATADARLVAREPLVLAGAAVFSHVMKRVSALPGMPDAPVRVRFDTPDGQPIPDGATFAHLHGPTATILRGERLALNFLQRLCGIATATRRCVDILGPRPAITDTRKTTPGMRELERYAVRCGGGHNHRFNLASGIMLKDNHIAAAGGILPAVARVRASSPHLLRVEVEVSDIPQVHEAITARADVIMLDNMDPPTTQAAISLIRTKLPTALIEVSGRVTPDRLHALKDLDVDIISSGALTHSVKAADISLLFDSALAFKS
jgi:nicotinate-nucleotide pyrophosphorylase (carboxylating)